MTRTTPTLTPDLIHHYEMRARRLRSRFVFALFGKQTEDAANGTSTQACAAVNDTGGSFDEVGKLAA
jgi:hypothetical protein